MLVKDKFIMVSGIGPGLGSKLAIHAAIEGAKGVALGARTAQKLDECETEIRKVAPDCQVLKFVVDIRDEAQCAAFAEKTKAAFGQIDALINNAYYHGPMGERIESGDYAHWQMQFETNVLGTIKMTRALIPIMRAQGNGSVVMISTMGVKMVPLADEGGYCASKAALYNATRKLATEIGPYGIRVNSLHPGWMWGKPVIDDLSTPTMQKTFGTPEEAYARVSAHNALRKIATDDECARAGLFLASDYASAITGASLDANAGAFLP